MIGRGANYATAFEAALKIKELAGVAAEPASPADFLHGPVAMLDPRLPACSRSCRRRPAGAAVRDVLAAAHARAADVTVIAEDGYAAAPASACSRVEPVPGVAEPARAPSSPPSCSPSAPPSAAASTSTAPRACRRSRGPPEETDHMPPIRIQGLTKTYKDGPRAVDHVDLEIRDGEFMVLVGPSGCGKSTLLQMLAGIVEASEGTIHIGDRDVTRLDPRKRDIAMVFQSYALYPHLSVRGNLGFGLKLRGTDKAEIAPPRRGRRAHPRARRGARPQAGRAVGRPAPARRDGPRDRARAARRS